MSKNAETARKQEPVKVRYVDQGRFHCMKRFCTEIEANVDPRSPEATRIEEVIKKALRDNGYAVEDVPAV